MSGTVCPRCHEPVRLPEASSAARVRCPWCSEEYELREALAGQPPLLQVVGGDLGHFGGGMHVVMPQEGSDEPDFGMFSFGQEDATGGKAVTPAISSGGTSSVRPRRKQGSPILGLLKVVAGGAAGILIAMAILQSIGRLPDMGFWPFRGPQAAWFGGDQGRGGRRRAMQPLPLDGPRQTANDENAPRLGQELEIPSLDQFANSGMDQAAEEGSRIEQLIASLEAVGLDAALEDESAEAVEAKAQQMAETFAELGALSASAGGLNDTERTRLNACVIAVGRNAKLRLALIEFSEQWWEQAAAEGHNGAFAIGVLEEGEDGWVLRGRMKESPRRKLELPADGNDPAANQGVLLFGAASEDDFSKIDVSYVRSIGK